jgi:hypothetical protein
MAVTQVAIQCREGVILAVGFHITWSGRIELMSFDRPPINAVSWEVIQAQGWTAAPDIEEIPAEARYLLSVPEAPEDAYWNAAADY